MARSYVAIYQNKKINYFVYYDVENHQFFKIAERDQKSLIALTSFVSIVFYAFMKDMSFAIDVNPFMMLLLSSMIGITLGYISIKLTDRAIEKGLPHRKEVIHPTEQELKMYLIEGKKQFRILVYMMLFLMFCMFLSLLMLYFMPQSVLMFLVNILFWVVIMVPIWAIRPIKRNQVRKQLENGLEKRPS